MTLEKWLELTGTTNKELGDKIGVHALTISRIANFRQEPRISLAKMICEATKNRVTIEDLAGYWVSYHEAKKKYG